MRILSHDALDAARHRGDGAADATVAALGSDKWIANALFRHLHRNDDPLPDRLPAAVRTFLAEHAPVPPWFDEGRARRAQRWASRHVLPITAALFCASLPTAYGAARGARVLAATGRMDGASLDRRVHETAQFVLDVLAEGGFGPDGAALRAIQKVRLLHAAIRVHLREKGLGHGEVPINQEDLLGTLFTFSTVVLRSLERLGVAIAPGEAEDYYALWRGVGAMLGVEEELLPLDLATASDVADRIAGRQLQASDHGRMLMASLLEGMERHLPTLRRAPRHLVRYLVGDRLADLLAVPVDERLRASAALWHLLPRTSRAPIASLALGLSRSMGRPLLEMVVAAKLRDAPASFAMPASGL